MQYIHRGQIYYADLYPVVGSEQSGTRPVLILQNDKGNRYSPTTIIAPLTGKRQKKPIPTHILVSANGLKVKSTVLLEQIMTLDKTRLTQYVGELGEETMSRIDKAMKVSLGIQ